MKLDFLGDWKRTHTCGELRPEHADQVVTLMGWVDRVRDLGSLMFLELRDRDGVTQVVFNRDTYPQTHAHAADLGREYVAAITGKVVERSASNVNPKVATGGIEVVAEELRVLNDARTPPFNIDDQQAMTDEETRLRFRFLDLRRSRMQSNIALRHKLAFELRCFMNEQGFYEIETPFLTRSTPEGARDYLVPSRIYPGSFYALPQSPQLFKQILMISGFDKYFQVVRCFRDEDFRADRQAEFTQIDLEMSYPQRETVWAVVEGMLQRMWKAAGVEIATPFPRMSYDDAMKAYGIDKPDLRLPPMVTVNECFGIEALEKLRLAPEHPVLAFRLPQCSDLSRKEREELQKFLEDKGGRGFVDLRNKGGALEGSLVKNFADAAQKVAQAAGAVDGDLIVVAGAPHGLPVKANDFSIYIAAGALRLFAGQKYNDRHRLLDPRDFRFLWVTDFPMFEWNPNEHRWEAAHHPFTSPHEHDMDKLESDPGAVRALAYDCVLNGTELGSGSIRIHRQDIQSVIFKALGFTEEQAHRRFGFFLDALAYGTPPHGGIALGLDRIVMLLAGENSLREVIAFPKTARAQDLMTDAPTPVDEAQLKELGLAVERKAGKIVFGYPEFWEVTEAEFRPLLSPLHHVAEALTGLTNAAYDPVKPHQRVILNLGLLSAVAMIETVTLAANGLGQGAMKTIRTMVEYGINAEYLRRAPEECKAFLAWHWVEERKVMVHLREHAPEQYSQMAPALVAEIEREFAKASGEFEYITAKGESKLRGGWCSLNLADRATKTDFLEVYRTVYPTASSIVHGSIGGLLKHFNPDEDVDRIALPPSPEWCGEALVAGYFCALRMVDTLCQTFGVQSKPPYDELCNEYVVTLKALTAKQKSS